MLRKRLAFREGIAKSPDQTLIQTRLIDREAASTSSNRWFGVMTSHKLLTIPSKEMQLGSRGYPMTRTKGVRIALT